jgi:hypothetical protein
MFHNTPLAEDDLIGGRLDEEAHGIKSGLLSDKMSLWGRLRNQ